MDRQYVGIDLHRRRSVIVRMNHDGDVLATVKLDNDPMALGFAIAEAGPDPEVAIEACYGWYWAADLLEASGAKVHLVHPSGLHWGSRRVKNDVRDATEIAQRLRRNDLPEAWIAPPAVRELRELVRYGPSSPRSTPAPRRRSNAVLAKEGIIPAHDLFGPTGAVYLDSIADKLDDAYLVRLESLRDLIELYDREIALVAGHLKRRLRDHAGYHAIQALHGVGPVMAAVFVAEIGDVSRFPTARHLCSWAGLTPRHVESDTKVFPRPHHPSRLGPGAVDRLRGGRPLPRGDPFRPAFQRIAERRGRMIARLAAARKLLTWSSTGCAMGTSGPSRRPGDGPAQPGRELDERRDPRNRLGRLSE